MAGEATVGIETGTTPAETQTETPIVAVDTPHPTFAETEKAYREQFDKSHGRDIAKLFPKEVKQEAPKVEPTKDAKEETPPAKVEAKTEPAKEGETEPEAVKDPAKPEDRPHPRSGAGRLKLKLALARQETENLKAQLANIQSLINAPRETKSETPVLTEPERKDFTDEATYLAAIRQYDKDIREAERKTDQEKRIKDELAANSAKVYNTFAERLGEVKKKHDDWDAVTAKAVVTFNPILEGVLVTADPEFLYFSATHQRDVRNLNDLNEHSVVAIGNSDNVDGVLRHLSLNPDDIDKLNILSPVKAQTFIGRLEAKIEAGIANPAKPDKIGTDTASPGAAAKSEKTGTDATEVVKPKPEDKPAKVETPARVRPEPPAKLKGGEAPSSNSWTDPTSMSLADRERLYKEDPRYAKRR